MSNNVFTDLYSVDCSGFVEHKNGFSYLSWPFAVAQLRKHDPEATWEVLRFDGKPFLCTECGYFVEVAVTVKGITLSQIHPVLDHRNKPVAMPDAFNINSSIQRCLVKAIALHGLGLSIYAGEDMPNPQLLGPTYINDAEVDEIRSMISETGSDERSFLAYIQAPAVEQITAGAQHSKALGALSAKLKKKQAAEAGAKLEPESESQPAEMSEGEPASEPEQAQGKENSSEGLERPESSEDDSVAEYKPRRRRRSS